MNQKKITDDNFKRLKTLFMKFRDIFEISRLTYTEKKLRMIDITIECLQIVEIKDKQMGSIGEELKKNL